MTMVIENQHRQYGGIGYDNVYQNHIHPAPAHFSDTWSSQTPSHPPPIYPSSMASNNVPMGPQPKREDVARPPPLSVPYSNIPVSAPSMGATTSYNPTHPYNESGLLVMQPDLPRTTTSFDQHPSYTAPSPMNNSFTPANYSPLDYAHSLHQHQQQQQQHQQPQHPQPPQSHPPPQHPDARNITQG